MKTSKSLSIIKNAVKLSTITSIVALMSVNAHALSVSGYLSARSIYNHPDGYPQYVGYTNSVDIHSFNSVGGIYSIDITAKGVFSNGVSDTGIFVWRNDGSLDASDLIAFNDDYFDLGNNGESGSVSGDDSFLSLNLSAGSYLLGVGSCCASFDYGRMAQRQMYSEQWDYEAIPYSLGYYEATITPQVPVPAAAWLMGSGLIGLVGLARRKKI